MSSVFYQTVMYLLFCCTWGTAFLAALINCENIYKAVCVSSISWSTFLFALVEGLNIFKAITSVNLMIAWGIFLIITGGYCLKKKNLLQMKITSLRQSAVSLYGDNGASVKALIIFIAFFMIARTLLALIIAPHDADSNSYHLPRIIYWIQHQSVDYYDTHVMRQLFSPVFAEYINLNVWLLTGGDFFINMLQNFSAYGCLILLYGIIRELGCGIKWALFGCILALTMNIFAAESMTSQVDLAGTFYLMILTYLIIEVLYKSKLTIFQFMLLGLVSGFIYITKTNACAPAAVIIIYVVLVKIFHGNFRIIPLGIISLICIGLIVSTTFYRNYNAFDGDFMAFNEHSMNNANFGSIVIGTLSPKYVSINIIKNLCTIGVERNALLLDSAVKTLANVLKIDINAPQLTWSNIPFHIQYSAGLVSANAHLVTPLFLMASVISLIYLIKRKTITEGLMFALILSMFSILIILRWQPWASRLILPALMVVIISIVYYFSEITKKFNKNSWKYKACYFLVLEIIFQCGVCSTEGLAFHSYLAVNNLRHPRYVQYWGIFARNGKMFAAYDNFSKLIDNGNYDNIGLDGIENMYQYPILSKYVPMDKRVECVTLLGDGREAKVLNPNFSPDIILVENVELNPEKIYTCNGNNYRCIYSMSDYDLHLNLVHYSAWGKEKNN